MKETIPTEQAQGRNQQADAGAGRRLAARGAIVLSFVVALEIVIMAEVERARGDVRLVHLMFHLKTRDLLTDEQRRLYHEARWSGHRPMGPHGGGSPGAGSPMK